MVRSQIANLIMFGRETSEKPVRAKSERLLHAMVVAEGRIELPTLGL
jgi:hypothetical protein